MENKNNTFVQYFTIVPSILQKIDQLQKEGKEPKYVLMHPAYFYIHENIQNARICGLPIIRSADLPFIGLEVVC